MLLHTKSSFHGDCLAAGAVCSVKHGAVVGVGRLDFKLNDRSLTRDELASQGEGERASHFAGLDGGKMPRLLRWLCLSPSLTFKGSYPQLNTASG